MPEFSPQAQEVFWAFNRAASGKPDDWHYLPAIAAALRAAVDQGVPQEWPTIEDYNEYEQGVAAAHIKYRNQILAIADELATTDEGTSYCRLAEQTASAAKLEDRLEALEHKLNTLRGDHLRMANAVANQLPDRTKFFVDAMKGNEPVPSASAADVYRKLAEGTFLAEDRNSNFPGESTIQRDLIQRLLSLAEQAVNEALDFEFDDPEDRYIWRELQELKRLVQQ